MQQPTISPEASAATIARLRAIGELALQRHHAAHQQQPRRSTAPYLRAALTCAREMARHAKRHPALREAALRLTETVIAAAQAAEAACFAAGGNSAPYLAVLIAAEGLCLTLAAAPTPAAQPTPHAPKPTPASPTPTLNQPRKPTTAPKRRHRPNKRAA